MNRNKIIYFSIIVVEILLCYILLFEATAIYKFIYGNINETYKILGEKNGIIIEEEYPNADEEMYDNQLKLYDDLKGLKNNSLGMFYVDISKSTNVLGTDIIQKNNYPQILEWQLSGKEDVIPTLYINSDMYNKKKFKLIEGEGLNWSSLDNDKKYILAGYNFKEFFNIGDSINLNNEEYTISGFLKKDEQFLLSTKSLFEEICNLNSFLIIPKDDKEIGNRGFSNMIITSSEKIIDAKAIKDLFSIHKLEYKVKTFDDSKEGYIERLGHGAKLKFFQVIILGIFIICGIVSAITNIIIKRKREFGVRYALGYTKASIIKLVFKEFVGVIFISYALCLSYYELFPKSILGSYIVVKVDFIQAIILGIISLLILFIVVLLIVYTILKLEPHKLIGGDRE